MSEKQSIVRISNVLNLTRQEFTVVEKHLFHCIIREIKEIQGFAVNIDNKEPISLIIPAADVLKKSKNTKLLKDALKKITSKSISFDFSKPDAEYFGSITPFSFASYEAIQGKIAIITIDINYKCKKLFLDLAEGYTNLQLDAILNLKSEYSIRMYELLSMYLNQKSWTINLTDLKSLLNLEDSKYANYGMFEKRILHYSQKELWEHCNLYFEWEIAAKKGKKITALTFHIKERDKQERIELSEEIRATQNFIATLSPADISHKSHLLTQSYSLTKEQVDYIMTNRNVFNDFVRIDIIIEDMIAKGKPPKDRTKYLAKSLGLDKIKFAKPIKNGLF